MAIYSLGLNLQKLKKKIKWHDLSVQLGTAEPLLGCGCSVSEGWMLTACSLWWFLLVTLKLWLFSLLLRVPGRCLCTRALKRISYGDISHPERLGVSPLLFLTAKFEDGQ